MNPQDHYIKVVFSLLQNHLEKRSCLQLCNTMGDGRLNSIHDEDTIADYILEFFGTVIKRGKSRELGDLWLDMSPYNLSDLPINIKCLNEKPGQRNNLFGLPKFFAYTFDDQTCSSKVGVAKTVKTAPQDKLLNKYGLVIVSKDSPKCWVGSLDEVPDPDISANPSNDFQLAWPSSRVSRTNQEYREMLTTKLHELYKKMAEPLKVFESF
jgi:hypothetical protein